MSSPLPSDFGRTRGAQADGLRRRGGPSGSACSGSSLAIVSGKGGVGKSLVAVNLSLALAADRRAGRVLLVDGDAGLANADLLLGWVPAHTLSEWIEGDARLDQVVTSGAEALDLLVSGSAPGAIELLSRLAARTWERPEGAPIGGHDTTIFDLGAGIGRDVVGLASACDRVWLVATPEPTSLADAYAMARRLVETRPGVALELVVNRARDREEGARTHVALDRMTRRFLGRGLALRGVLPEDGAVLRAVARQEPLVRSAPRAPITRRMSLLAESVAEELATHSPRAGASHADVPA